MNTAIRQDTSAGSQMKNLARNSYNTTMTSQAERPNNKRLRNPKDVSPSSEEEQKVSAKKACTSSSSPDKPQDPIIIYRYTQEDQLGVSQFISKEHPESCHWIRYPYLNTNGTILFAGSTSESLYVLEQTPESSLVMYYFEKKTQQWKRCELHVQIQSQINPERVQCAASGTTVCIVVNNDTLSAWIFYGNALRWEDRPLSLPQEMTEAGQRFKVCCESAGLIVFRGENMSVKYIFEIRSRGWKNKEHCLGLLQNRGLPSFFKAENGIHYKLETLQHGKLRAAYDDRAVASIAAVSVHELSRMVWKAQVHRAETETSEVKLRIHGARFPDSSGYGGCPQAEQWAEMALPNGFGVVRGNQRSLRFEILVPPNKGIFTYRTSV